MRRIFSLLAVVFMVTGIVGCGSSTVTQSDSPSSNYASTSSHSGHASVATVDDATFDSEIAGYKGVAIVDFGATWCGYCRKISPEIDRVASENAGRIKVTKLDIDKSPNIANQFGVNSVPCVVLFKDGKEIDRARGYRTKDELMSWIQSKLPDGEVSSN